MIYLDYQATTPLAPEALAAMMPWLAGPDATGFANPHSAHPIGRSAWAAVELAREQVAALLPAGGRVIFTSGATEAINLAILGRHPRRIAYSAIEHSAVKAAAAASGAQVDVIPVNADGLVDAGTKVKPGTDLVAVMQVNNEIGTIQPIAALAEAAHAAGALLLCDAVQGAGKIGAAKGADLIAVTAHKLYGPKGIGALWIRDGVELEPLIHGGGQEDGLRSGTLSPALCAGFGAAAAVSLERQEADAAHVAVLWHKAREALALWHLNGSASARWHGNLNVRRDGLDVARLMSDLRDIAFSAGSSCASESGKPSQVLTALGLDRAQIKSSIRIGFGRYSTEAEIAAASVALNDAATAQGT